MLRRRITTSGNSAALVLPQDVLGLMGLAVGDEVDLSLVEKTLIVRPLPEQARAEKVQAAVDQVFRTRSTLLRRLAHEDGPAHPAASPKRPRRRRRN